MTIDLNTAAKSTQQQSYNPDEAASARIEDKERVGKATTLQEIRKLEQCSTPFSLSSMPNDILLNIQKHLGERGSIALAPCPL